MLFALFITTNALPHLPHERAKRYRSSRTSEGEDARSQKKERTDLEVARRSSLLGEEACQVRSRELAAGVSSSGVEAVERTPLRVQILLLSLLRVRVLGNRTRLLVYLRRYAPQVCFTYHPIFIFLMH